MDSRGRTLTPRIPEACERSSEKLNEQDGPRTGDMGRKDVEQQSGRFVPASCHPRRLLLTQSRWDVAILYVRVYLSVHRPSTSFASRRKFKSNHCLLSFSWFSSCCQQEWQSAVCFGAWTTLQNSLLQLRWTSTAALSQYLRVGTSSNLIWGCE